jgi:magnesium transporter
MIATRLKNDPTVMSAPLITTLVDATGLLICFEIARYFLKL